MSKRSYRHEWRDHFRHPTYRPNQEQALDRIGEHLDNGTKIVVAEIPTGVGKSDIAMALSRSTGSSYIATSQNPLIDQYVKDFGDSDDFWYIKGRTNYKCPSSEYQNCQRGSDAKCMNYEERPPEGMPAKDFESPCPYKANRNECARQKVALTNLTYFAVGVRPQDENSIWGRRDIAVIDESHNLPSEVLNLVQLTITNRDLADVGLVEDVGTKFMGEVVDQHEFMRFAKELKSRIAVQIEKLNPMATHSVTVSDMIKNLNEIRGRIIWFEESVECGVDWLVEVVRDQSGKRNYHKVVARPLESGYFAQNIFFTNQAEQYLLQSATIVDHKMYCKELGIDEFKYVEEPSPFDLNKRRPVFLLNSGDMGFKFINNSFPNAMMDVDKVLKAYHGKRGLVHTTSYALQKKMKDIYGFDPRCLFLEPDNREEIFEKFFRMKDAVLFSPSLMEGFDGKGDLLRFQILMKIPYPDFADKRVKIKAENDRNWYNYQAKKPLIQSVGRGMRDMDDWCDYYVIDSRFEKFAKYNLPTEFCRTIVSSRDAAIGRLRKMYLGLV